MQGNGFLPGCFDLLLNGAVGCVDRVRLGRETEIDDCFGEGEVAFGRTEEVDGFLGGEAQVECLRRGEADVFHGHSHDAAGEVERIFAGGEHAGKPVESGVGIGVTDAFVERGDEVVVLLAGFVVHEDALLDGFLGDGVVDVFCGLQGLKPRSIFAIFGT